MSDSRESAARAGGLGIVKTWKGRTEDGTFAVELQSSVDYTAAEMECEDCGKPIDPWRFVHIIVIDLDEAAKREPVEWEEMP